MSQPALSPQPITRAALELRPRLLWLVALGLVMLAAAWAVPPSLGALGLTVPGLTLLALAALVGVLALRHRRSRVRLREILATLLEEEPAPCLTTDSDGVVDYANPAARARWRAEPGAALLAVFDSLIAAPATVLYRLQNRAAARGFASEEVVSPDGRLRITVHRVGTGLYLWRSDTLADRVQARDGESIGLPMMTVSKAGTVLAMNEALRRLLGGRESTLDRVIIDLPLRPGEIHRVAGAHGPVQARVIEVPRAAGGREIYLVPENGHHRVAPGEWGMVENLPVPLLRLDAAGRITMATARARRLLNDEYATGSHLSDQLEGLGRPLSDWLREAWDGRNLGRVETMRAAKAEERFLQVSLEQFHDDQGPALVAVLNDATELKSLETQFVQSQKMQAIGQLAGGVAHDFNNLLTAISGHCDLLLLRHDEADPDYSDLNQISQNANRAAALVSQLLAFSRKQTLRPERLDLAETLGDLSHLLGRLVGERVQLSFEPGHDIAPVRADKRQLEQVMMNLVVNARDAMMPAGGNIRLVLENLHLSHTLERDRARVPPGDYVTIRVTDEGTGISPELRDKIFEPFFTTKGAGKGTGLGLSMVYGIVKQSGAYIFVDSIEGSGTTFTLYFPVFREDGEAGQAVADMADATDARADGSEDFAGNDVGGGGDAEPLPRAVAAPPEVTSQTQDGIILLVEDEAPVRAFASRALQLRGFTVLEAESAEDALKLLEDESLAVDVFVTDVVMPGKDGPTWVAEALRTRPEVRVVFVSGYAEDSVAEHQARIPNAVFLPKPFSLAELTATVAGQLNKAPRAQTGG